MGIWRHDEAPMLIVTAGVIEQHGLRMMEQKHPAQHVAMAEVTDAFGVAAGVPHRQSEVMISVTHVLRHARLRAGKYKDA